MSRRSSGELLAGMAEDRFEYGLAALLDGFEARLAKARAAGEAAGEAPGSAADTAEGA